MTKDEVIRHLIKMLPISLDDMLEINESILADENWANSGDDYDTKCRNKLIEENKILGNIIKSITFNAK